MTVEVFDEVKFSNALEDALLDTELIATDMGHMGGEVRYAIPVKVLEDGTPVSIMVNSSIRENGLSAGSGKDSIRIWLESDGEPLGNKTQRWVTRVPGWEKRLADVISKVLEMADAIDLCPTCGTIEKVWVAKKEGANQGRLFKKCEVGCAFVWLDEITKETPGCPNCNHEMVKRNGKYGEFWGCRRFPDCRGTRNLDWKEKENSRPPIKEPTINKEHENGAVDKIMATAPPFKASEDQENIFKWMEEGSGNLTVEAVAGSGKTTTGVKMLELIAPDKKVLFVAFNRHIAKELSRRAPRHVTVTTYHSLGYKAVRAAFKDCEVDTSGKKIKALLETYWDKTNQAHLFAPTRQLASLVMANLSGTDPTSLRQLSDYHGIALNGDEDEIFRGVHYLVGASSNKTSLINFDDMCYFPFRHKLPMDKYDVIFIDEAQDTNRNQIWLAMASCHEDTRVIAVGDRFQSLYGFRGADVDAIPNLIESLQAETLPLSITYRNPKSVVALVNERFPHIDFKAAPWAIEGEVLTETYNQALSGMDSGDMVLCRNNAPLVKPAFALIRSGIKAVIRGRDIGKGLINLIDKMGESTVNGMLRELSIYEEQEVTKLIIANKANQAQTIQDKIDTIVAISDGCDRVVDVLSKIQEVFSDDVEGVVFSTVHKAKGLQAESVYILNPELMPSAHAEQDWELQQEENIQYVAYTRAQVMLIFVRE